MREHKNTRNPILPLDIHIPDSEGHVMPDGKLYLYGSFDAREDAYCSEKYHVVSTPDMKNWTIHDVSFSCEGVPWYGNLNAPKYLGIDWSKPTPFLKKMLADAVEDSKNMKDELGKADQGGKQALLFAPDCIHKDGKYYLYFCMADDSEGVAISDKPEGPFMNATQLPCGGIDPAIFIDDDGQAYYFWGQIFSHGVKLNKDMVSFDAVQIVDNLVTEEEHFFHEGSSIRKIGDTYYYVYADMERGKPTSLGYATSKSPLGPFTYRGIIIDNAKCDPASWNNHGSIECVNGQWYVFYHRCSRGMHQHRRLCIEPITIDGDGTIPEVKMTSQGIGQPFALGEAIMGYQACELKGTVFIGVNENVEYDCGEKLMHISNDDEAVFRYIRCEREHANIQIQATGTGRIELLLNGKLAGVVSVQNGVQQYGEIRMEPGEYEMKLRFRQTKELEIYQIVMK